MNSEHDTKVSDRHEGDSALRTILRGEEVLEEARHVSQKISARVTLAVTARVPQDDRLEVGLPAGLS